MGGGPVNQYGFFFDQSRCTGCQTCSLACKSYHDLPAGPLKYLRIYQYEKGPFPDVSLHVQWIPCYHCLKPDCMEACPSNAIFKEPKYGAVLIDNDKCDGCRLCYEACPYGSPVFESDNPTALACKCTLCYDRLEQEKLPVCVRACPMRALDFGPLPDLMHTYGPGDTLEDLPDRNITKPSIIFKSRRKKRRLVPYNSEKALALFMRRDPLPPIFSAQSEATDIPEGLVGRDKLVLKHPSGKDLLDRTRNDEG